MQYNLKEYVPIFDTPAKKAQELAIASKIMTILNQNKYDNLEEFIKTNSNYQDFLKKNNMTNVIKHFGNTLNEADYTNILENLKTLTKAKMNFEKENINTTNIEKKEYTTYSNEDKNYFLDNTNSSKSIEEQMVDLQPTNQDFQTADKKKNTENMFKELEKQKKESLNIQPLNQIDFSKLTKEQQELFQVALNYQIDSNDRVKIDLNRGIIINSNNKIFKISKNSNGEFMVLGDNNEKKNVKENNEITQVKGHQKTLKPSPNTIYSTKQN